MKRFRQVIIVNRSIALPGMDYQVAKKIEKINCYDGGRN